MPLQKSEWQVMEILWQNGITRASDVAKLIKPTTNWSRNTTYTIIKKCIDKGYIERLEPHFYCNPLVKREDAVVAEAENLINSKFNGSLALFVSGFSKTNKLSDADIQELEDILARLKQNKKEE